ncbi:MAG: hypothetical protein J6T01_05165 [Kiritimatiellae bacterium]|nr:hypothetical protein [Kiritimatiellia bacterium]
MNKTAISAVAAFGVFLSAESAPVEWVFPRTGGCHEGMAFSDGVTGVLVWGGDGELRLTVGRADLWDHRGGYPWTPEQNYSNIVSLVRTGRNDALLALFRRVAPAGEPRNPYMLPLGRVVLKIPGAELATGTLDPFTGLGRIVLADGRTVELAAGRESRVFAMKFPEGVEPAVETVHCMEFPAAGSALGAMGFPNAEKFAAADRGGFTWKLPADDPVSLVWRRRGSTLAVATGRGGVRDFAPDFSRIAAESVAQWRGFWKDSARVNVPDPVVQRVFDYGMYRFGAMTDPGGVPAGLQGPWLEDDKLVPWNGDYHFNINVQECYSPAYRGGHFAHLMPLFRMVLSWRPLLAENARKFVGVDGGYVLPHSVDDRGVCIGGFWTGTIDHASTAWVAAMMFKYVKYSGDTAFLKKDAYDFMKGAMKVYRAMMEERGGRLSIPVGPSPEWGAADVRKAVGRDPSFQLAAAHRLCRDLAAAAEMLGEKPDPMWLDVEKRLPQYTSGEGGIQLFEGQPFVVSHRHHSHMAGLYPFDTIDIADPAAAGTVAATYRTWVGRGTGEWTGWCLPWAAILHLHVGNAAAAAHLIRAWDAFFCDDGHGSHHNAVRDGFTVCNNGLGIMQMDGQCAAATAVMEMMVHEVDGRTEFFRGCPSSWKDVSFENIAIPGGGRVSGRRVDGKVSVKKVIR